MTQIKILDQLAQINVTSLKSAIDNYMTSLHILKYRGKKQKTSLKKKKIITEKLSENIRKKVHVLILKRFFYFQK